MRTKHLLICARCHVQSISELPGTGISDFRNPTFVFTFVLFSFSLTPRRSQTVSHSFVRAPVSEVMCPIKSYNYPFESFSADSKGLMNSSPHCALFLLTVPTNAYVKHRFYSRCLLVMRKCQLISC